QLFVEQGRLDQDGPGQRRRRRMIHLDMLDALWIGQRTHQFLKRRVQLLDDVYLAGPDSRGQLRAAELPQLVVVGVGQELVRRVQFFLQIALDVRNVDIVL